MKLNLSLIMSSVSYTYEYVSGNPNFALRLIGVCPFITGFETPSSEILYISHWEKLSVAPILPKYVFCIGGGEEAMTFFNDRKICAVIFPADCDILILFNDVSHTFVYYNELESNLYNALVSDASTRAILNCCGEFFKAHVTLYNSDFSLIDYNDRYAPPPDDEQWNEILANKRSTLPPIPREKVQMLPSNPSEFPRATFIDVEGLPLHYNIAFDYGHSRFATMIVTETSHKLSPAQHWLVDYVADAISPVISRRYNSAKDTRNYIRGVISKTLHEKKPNEELVRNTLDRLDWKENDDYQLIVVSLPQSARNISSYLYNYENVFADAHADCIATFFDDFLLILLHNMTFAQIDSFRPTLEKQLAMDGGICSFGLPFCNFSQLPIQYNLAIAPIMGYPSNETVRHYVDILSKHLIGELNTVYPVEAVCHKAAVKIHEYDKQNGTNYLLTLETYLMHSKSLMAASEKLFIHRSTMTYRLKCIEKIAEMNFDDPRERLCILLSCIALRVLFDKQ